MRICTVSSIHAAINHHHFARLDLLGRPVHTGPRRLELPPYLRGPAPIGRVTAPTPPEAIDALGRALDDARRDEALDEAYRGPGGAWDGRDDSGEDGDGGESSLEDDR
jgi:hypothetical protein